MEVNMLSKNKLQSAYVSVMVFMASEMASAATANTSTGKAHMQQILNTPTFQTTVTVAFAILALWKWIEYLQDFQAQNALTRAITPALLTFMAFAWGDVLGWVGIM